MNIQPLKELPEIAKAKARHYARELKKARMKDVDIKYRLEYEVLRRAYAELAKGTKVLDIHQAIAAGGFYDNMFPKLAIARADQRDVRMRWGAGTRIEYHSGQNKWGTYEKHSIRHVDVGITHNRTTREGWIVTLDASSRVPKIPLEHIPEGKPLSKFYILWEVEKWEQAHIDRDPYLLRYLGGPFYAVVAEWDLTDLEVSIQKHMRFS